MKYVMLFLLLACLQACSRQTNSHHEHTMTVSAATYTSPLYYAGTVMPIKTTVIPSPADGAVMEVPFQYGEQVNSGQLLFLLSSTKFLTNYKSAIMQFVKAKNEFNNNQTQLTEAVFLHKNQLISDDDFKMKKSSYYAARLALLEAKDTLDNLLHQLNIKNIKLDQLSIANIDQISQALHLQINSENIRVFSPAAGVVLAPSKNESESKKRLIGDTVKQGDALAVIGDMSGISVRIKVNELTVNQLHPGQKVKVTGIAFPDEMLVGEIKRVDRQGEIANGGMPVFLVDVVVPKLTLAQQNMIHAGMSAKVEIELTENSQIMIPMAAVHEKEGLTYVERIVDHAKPPTLVAIKTGKTTMNAVIVLSGLQAGDQIVLPD